MTAVAPDSATLATPPTRPDARTMSAEQRRNTWLLGLDMAVFAMGRGALGQLTIIPLFVSNLTDNPLAFALLGMVQSANLLTRVTGPIEYAPPERRPSYVALAFGVVGPFAALAPLLGGQIVAWGGYAWLFGLSAAVALVAVLTLGDGARARERRAGAA